MEEMRAVVEKLENTLYLEKHNLQIYFEDAVAQMLSVRLENQANKPKPTKFLKEYFCSVHQGTHILFREFSFINSTLYNRLCVMKAIMQIYKPLLYREEKLNAKDYHSLLQLVWPDIPLDIVHSAFIGFETPEQKEEVQLSFLEFVKAMKSSFCKGNFDHENKIIFCQLEAKVQEFSKICKQGDKVSSNPSEADFWRSLEESEKESDEASLWSVTSNLVQTSEFKRIFGLKESESFYSDDFWTDGKLSRSSSGSKDASKSEQNVSTFSRASSASLRGRLSGKQLSNSLSLLETTTTRLNKLDERIDTENNFSTHQRASSASLRGRLSGKQLSNSLSLLETTTAKLNKLDEKLDTENTRRHRSKSAVTIQRSYLHGRP